MSVSINDLPIEVIAHIFSFVRHKNDRRNLSLVSKKFKAIVRDQSKKHNLLDLMKYRLGTPTSITVFEQSNEFPFQKLKLFARNVEKYRDLWLRHGAKITKLSILFKLNEIGMFGHKLKELFPNLKSLHYERFIEIKEHSKLISTEEKDKKFSEKVEELNLFWWSGSCKNLAEILGLFPGLKRLNILNYKELGWQKDSEVEEFKNFLDEWLLKLEIIEFEFWVDNLDLLRAFDDERSHDQIHFNYLNAHLTQENVEILKRFFSCRRHVRSMTITFHHEIIKDSEFFGLIDRKTKIDRLTIFSNGGNLALLEGLFNARGIKEIHIDGANWSLYRVHFTSEALLKVKVVRSWNAEEQEVSRIPLFRNLRVLDLDGIPISNEGLRIIVENFLFLEELYIRELAATNIGLNSDQPSFSNLKNLRCLEINRAPTLENSSFEYGFELPNLEILTIGRSPNISLDGIKSLVANCPKLEQIEFAGCDNINEDCVDFIVQNLFYIDEIHLLKCKRLTLDSILKLQEKHPGILIS